MLRDVELILIQMGFQLNLSMRNSCPVKEENVEIASTFSILLLLMIIMETIRLHMVMLHRKLIPAKKRRTYSL